MATINEVLKYWQYTDDINPMLVGAVGMGKTSAIRKAAEEAGVNLETMVLAGKPPSEVIGIAMPDNKTGEMIYMNSRQLERLKENDWVFFDEFLNSMQDTRNVVLTLIESREKLDGNPLPQGVKMIGATNPTVAPKQVMEATRDRFLWIPITMDDKEWTQYLKETRDIQIPNDVIRKVNVGTKYGTEKYNVKEYNYSDRGYLSPRTYTKLIDWAIRVPESEYQGFQSLLSECLNFEDIDDITNIRKDYIAYINDPERLLKAEFEAQGYPVSEMSFDEMIEFIESLELEEE